MSLLEIPRDVLFFCSVLYNVECWDDEKIKEIFEHFEFEIQDELTPVENPLIGYYSKEMGETLKRKILIFKNRGNRDQLISLKKITTDLEIDSMVDGKRTINLDCGYLSLENMVLATGKPYSHRIYLQDGVYAELTYKFENKSFSGLPWTYPDYQHPEKIDFFNKNRQALL